MRAWIAAEGLTDRAAWVSVGRGEHDAQAFWLSVLDSLRRTRIGSERVRELTGAPGLDGATVVRRLLEDLDSLDERLWLVIDDLHELHADEAIRQVELLLASAPWRSTCWPRCSSAKRRRSAGCCCGLRSSSGSAVRWPTG